MSDILIKIAGLKKHYQKAFKMLLAMEVIQSTTLKSIFQL